MHWVLRYGTCLVTGLDVLIDKAATTAGKGTIPIRDGKDFICEGGDEGRECVAAETCRIDLRKSGSVDGSIEVVRVQQQKTPHRLCDLYTVYTPSRP